MSEVSNCGGPAPQPYRAPAPKVVQEEYREHYSVRQPEKPSAKEQALIYLIPAGEIFYEDFRISSTATLRASLKRLMSIDPTSLSKVFLVELQAEKELVQSVLDSRNKDNENPETDAVPS